MKGKKPNTSVPAERRTGGEVTDAQEEEPLHKNPTPNAKHDFLKKTAFWHSKIWDSLHFFIILKRSGFKQRFYSALSSALAAAAQGKPKGTFGFCRNMTCFRWLTVSATSACKVCAQTFNLFLFLSSVQGVHLTHRLWGACTATARREEDVQRCGGFAQAKVRKSDKSLNRHSFVSHFASGKT